MKKPASFTGTKNNGSQAFDGLQAASSWTGLDNTPIPSISTSNTSPCFIQTGGFRAAPTPPGVPMMITSPGSSVMHSVISTIVSATPQIMSEVLELCMTTPLSRPSIRKPLAPGGRSPAVTKIGRAHV